MKTTLLIIGMGLLLASGLIPVFNTTPPKHQPVCPGNIIKVAPMQPKLHQAQQQTPPESFSFIDDVALNFFPVLKKLI